MRPQICLAALVFTASALAHPAVSNPPEALINAEAKDLYDARYMNDKPMHTTVLMAMATQQADAETREQRLDL
jgi:hypothetical protein